MILKRRSVQCVCPKSREPMDSKIMSALCQVAWPRKTTTNDTITWPPPPSYAPENGVQDPGVEKCSVRLVAREAHGICQRKETNGGKETTKADCRFGRQQAFYSLCFGYVDSHTCHSMSVCENKNGILADVQRIKNSVAPQHRSFTRWWRARNYRIDRAENGQLFGSWKLSEVWFAYQIVSATYHCVVVQFLPADTSGEKID